MCLFILVCIINFIRPRPIDSRHAHRARFAACIYFTTRKLKIIQCFTLIAILISCLGVYGLVLYIVQRRTKEIGVRKVLGASVSGILRLIYRDFVALILAGFVLAVPFSYYLIMKWLENFTFHTSIDMMTYALSFALVMVVISVTISYHVVRAALANPVLSLRSE